MSEAALPIGFADSAQSALDASKSAGQLLLEAREAHGLHVAALAVSLKVPVKKIEALEADRFEELGDTVFVRALASSVCRALKTDAKPILAKLPQLNTRVLGQSGSGVNVAFRTRADGPAPSALASINRPLLAVVAAILLAAVAVMLWPDFAARSAASSASNTANAAATAQSSVSGVSLGNPINVSSVPAGTVSDASTGASTSALSASPSLIAASAANLPANAKANADTSAKPTISVTPALSTPSVSSPTSTVTVTPLSVAALSVPADSVIVFAAIGESWVEVKDSAGRVVLQRTLQNGEKVGAGPALGKLPFKVTVGRSNLTQVAVRGQAFDLAPVSSKDAVARFSVK